MIQAKTKLQTCYRQKCPIRSEDIQFIIDSLKKEFSLFKTHKEYYQNEANCGNNGLELIDIKEYN